METPRTARIVARIGARIGEQPAEWPEAEETEAGLSYDPGDPESIESAREALRDRLGLDYLPTLCSEPKRRVMSRLRAGMRRLLRRNA